MEEVLDLLLMYKEVNYQKRRKNIQIKCVRDVDYVKCVHEVDSP